MGALRRVLAIGTAAACIALAAAPSTAAQPTVAITELFRFGDAIAMDLTSTGLPVLLAHEYTYVPEDGGGGESPPVEQPDYPGLTDIEEQKTYLMQCFVADCSEDPVITEVTFDLAEDTSIAAMRLSPADRPLVVSYGDGALELTECNDLACSSWTTQSLRPGGTELTGVEAIAGLEYAPDGTFHLIMNRLDGSALHVRCGDVTCAGRQFTTIDGPVRSLTLDPTGLPAYTVGNQLVRCADPACSTSDVGELPGASIGVTFGSSGFPLVLVAKRTQLLAEYPLEHYGLLMHCDDPLCLDEEQHAHRVISATLETSHRHANGPVSVHVGPYGLPVVGRYFNPGFDGDGQTNVYYEFHAECVSVHCAGPSNQAADAFSMVRSYTELPTHFETTPDNTPVMFSAGEARLQFPTHQAVVVTACIPGAQCFADNDNDGIPDWAPASAESPSTKWCRDDVVTVDLSLGHIATAGHDVILGTPDDDVIAAGEGNDIVCSGGGNDTVWGQGGDDIVYGDDGDDKLRGGDGNDLLFGGAGSDDLNGGRDNDEVWGQDGDDVAVRGGTGDDRVNGGTGDDAVVAGNGGSDSVHGASGADKVTGGPRPDEVRGGEGNDIVKGNGGADMIYGDTGDDALYGGPGGDSLLGGSGNDRCNGGTGSDATMSCESLVNIP